MIRHKCEADSHFLYEMRSTNNPWKSIGNRNDWLTKVFETSLSITPHWIPLNLFSFMQVCESKVNVIIQV